GRGGAAAAVGGRATAATADTSTDVRATARAVVPQAMSLPKASLNICFGFFISVLPFPFAGWRQGCRSAAPGLRRVSASTRGAARSQSHLGPHAVQPMTGRLRLVGR